MRGQSQELDHGPEDDTQGRPVIPHTSYLCVCMYVSLHLYTAENTWHIHTHILELYIDIFVSLEKIVLLYGGTYCTYFKFYLGGEMGRFVGENQKSLGALPAVLYERSALLQCLLSYSQTLGSNKDKRTL